MKDEFNLPDAPILDLYNEMIKNKNNKDNDLNESIISTNNINKNEKKIKKE